MPLQKRFARECILCDQKVKKYAQHLRRVHSVSKEDAACMSKANKDFVDKPEIPERSASGRKRWICGYRGCEKNVVVRSHHLIAKHHLEKGTESYSMALGRFRLYRRDPPRYEDMSSETDSLPDISMSEDDDSHEASEVDIEPRFLRPTENSKTDAQPMAMEPTEDSEVVTPPVLEGLTGNSELNTEPMLSGKEADYQESLAGMEDAVPPTPPGGSPGHWECMTETLEEFYKTITSLQGGMKPDHVAQQHSKQVQKFWQFSGEKTTAAFDLDNLNAWVESLLEQYQPGTIKSYLCSVSTFLKFAFSRGYLKEKVKTLVECNTFIQNSMRFLAKRQAQRQVEVDEKATEELLDPEARCFILNGSYLDTVRGHFKTDKHKFYNQFRDALMLYMTISNGTRVSALMNLTIPQIHKAAPATIEETEYYTISVLKHKTSASRGAAKISIPRKEYQYVKKLAKYVSTYYPGDERLFRNQQGSPYTTQTSINRRIQQAWKCSGAYAKFGRLNSRINRQTMTCQGREKDPSKAKEIADQLKHRVTTADKFYHVYESASASAKTIHWLNETSSSQQMGKDAPEGDSDDEDRFFKEHEIPGLQDDITSEQIRMAITEVLLGRSIEDLIEEAGKWKYNTRKFTTGTSYMSIHRALKRKLEKVDINIDEEILGMLSLESLSKDMQLKTTFLSVFAVELARHYGCNDDVYETPFKRTAAAAPTSDLPPGKGKGVGKKSSAKTGQIPDTPRMRMRIVPEVADRIKEVYADVINKARSGEQGVVIKDIREHIHLFPDFSEMQIRDKIRNILKSE